MTAHYFVSEDELSLGDFQLFCQQEIDAEEYPLASDIADNVLFYQCEVLADAAITDRYRVLNELHQALSCGPGVVAIRGLYAHSRQPEDLLNLICQAWLGPQWRISSQSSELIAHETFPSGVQAAEFPVPLLLLAQYLTLKGVVATGDGLPAEGPLRFLPWSHQYEHGYRARSRQEFEHYFAGHAIQPTLQQGDALFFNPALFCAAASRQQRGDYTLLTFSSVLLQAG